MDAFPKAEAQSFHESQEKDYRAKEIKEFIEKGAGVKGLVDSGVDKIPRIFIHPPETLPKLSSSGSGGTQFKVPVIDFQGIETADRRAEVVNKIRNVSETWGFFQIINHGVPVTTMDNMLDGVRQFHEQPLNSKKEWYSRDGTGQVTFSYYLNALPVTVWRDSLACNFADENLEDEEATPQDCRKAMSEYLKCVFQLKETLSELLSEALGLGSDYLSSIKCMKSAYVTSHYYPACPQPELTIGTGDHTDPSFLTILLQDNTGGLQVLHQDQWVDVPFLPGSLIANFGDLMQLITNDKFRSARHRVLARGVGPRVSTACFFSPAIAYQDKAYGPAEDLVSKENPPIYKATTPNEYFAYFRSHVQERNSALSHFKLSC